MLFISTSASPLCFCTGVCNSWCVPGLWQSPVGRTGHFKAISHPSLQIKAVYCRDSIFPWPWAGWVCGFEAREGQTTCRPYRRSPSIDCVMELRSQATFRWGQETEFEWTRKTRALGSAIGSGHVPGMLVIKPEGVQPVEYVRWPCWLGTPAFQAMSCHPKL